MQYIYSRVSTDKQETQNQLSSLKELFPLAAVFEEVASGAKARPVLQTLLGSLQSGDVLIVAALDRLGRRTSEVLGLIEDLERRGVVLKSIREGVDYSTIAGRLVTQILCACAEMERRLISERTKMALEARKKAGVKLGGPAKYSPEMVQRVRELRAGGQTVRDVAKATGMSASRVSQLTRAA
jgi:putative DNA-invertase from lambdoid prophage Rac